MRVCVHTAHECTMSVMQLGEALGTAEGLATAYPHLYFSWGAAEFQRLLTDGARS